MFVITADQVDSRHTEDIAEATMLGIEASWGSDLLLPVDRTAGDEIQLLLEDAAATLAIVLDLTRTGGWSVGCGYGTVNLPLPAHAREANGPAFVAARDAVDAAKKRDGRFALRGPDDDHRAEDIEALVDLLLFVRARRSPQGWELYDLMVPGRTQAEAAGRLGITPQAASKRARAAAIRHELAAIPAIGNLLAEADTGKEEPTA
ncbi:MAG TPA: DNA-binding protein [Lacisediminihabitans sp.]